MQYLSSRIFDKQFTKLSRKIKRQFIERVKIFIQDPSNQTLNNHGLGGKYKNCRSINITGDIRIIYEMRDSNTAYFLAIGSHSELYK